MTTKAKRILCLLLSMVMLLSLLPVAALADGGTTFDSSWTELDITELYKNGKTYILKSGNYYLSANVDLGDNWLQMESKDVTIDLKGHVLKGSEVMTIKNVGGNLTVLDSAPTTTNTIDGKTFNGGVIFNSNSSGKAISLSSPGNPTLTLKGGTMSAVTTYSVTLNVHSTFYADGGVIDKNVDVSSGTISRHDDATDYTTFNGDVFNAATIEDKAKLTVNFVDSGTTVETQKVLKGHKLTKPTDPTSNESLGLSFLGWYKGDTPWNFDDPVTESMTLTAKWQHDSSWTILNNVAKTNNSINLDDPGNYYLNADLEDFTSINISANVIIDLNGHNLKCRLNCAINIHVQLTLMDSGTGGKVMGSGSGSNLNASVINLVSGEYDGVKYYPSLTLKSGTICGTVGLNLTNDFPCTFYADGGTVEGRVTGTPSDIVKRHDGADYTTFGLDISCSIDDKAKLTVNFVDGSDTITQKVLRGHKLTKPTPDGKLLLSCTKADGTPWDFNTPVTEHTNGVFELTAKWLGVEGSQAGFTAKLGEASETDINSLGSTAGGSLLSKDYLSTFSLKYVDADGNAPATPTTLTISGVDASKIDTDKPVYVIAFYKDGPIDVINKCRAELDSDGKLSFTMNGKDSSDFLAGCTIAITQSTLSGDIALTLTLPQKLEKDGDKYIVNYSVNAEIPITDYRVDNFTLYVNGKFNNAIMGSYTGFLNATEPATLDAKLTGTELISGQISAYAELLLTRQYTYSHPLFISPTLSSNVCLVEFAESSEPDAKITDAYLVETGKSLGDSMPADLVRSGYSFVGWFYKDSSDTEVRFSGDTAVTTSITVYPKFARDTFSVIFDPKNDESLILVCAPTNEALGDLVPADPKKAGYSFVGWFYINEDGNETEFTDETPVTGNETKVYAKWSVIVNYYTLTYVSNGGTEYAPERYTYGTVVELDKVPTREGYAFTGWFADAELTEKIDSVRMNYFKTVYAGWEKEKAEFTLTYVSNGGTEYAPEAYAEGTVVALDKVPVHEGYVFTGWYADETLKQAVTSVEMTSDKTVYAGWKGEYVPPELNSGDHIAYVKGYVDGTVKPMNNLTRAETAMMLYRLLTDEHRAEIAATTNNYTDVSAKDWYNEAVSTMTKGGYITGYVDGTFCGGNNITRSEFIAILVRFIGVIDGAQCSYSDVPADHWAYDYIATATTAGWIVGSGDGKFNPDALITRAEAMTIINRVLDRGVDGNSTLPEFKLWPDNSPDDWFYFDVIEATNSHEYTGSRPSENWLSVEK